MPIKGGERASYPAPPKADGEEARPGAEPAHILAESTPSPDITMLELHIMSPLLSRGGEGGPCL